MKLQNLDKPNYLVMISLYSASKLLDVEIGGSTGRQKLRANCEYGIGIYKTCDTI
jgi:hypothetical protein